MSFPLPGANGVATEPEEGRWSTHEDLLRFILGPDYRKYLESTGIVNRPVVRHLRSTYTAPQLVLMLTGIVLSLVALTFVVFPQSLFFLGLVRTPVSLAAIGGPGTTSFSGPGNISLETSAATRVEWADGDYHQVLGYTLANKGDLYTYPTILVSLLDAKGTTLDTLNFGGVLGPGMKVSGKLYWGRLEGNGNAVAFLVRVSAAKETTSNLYVPPSAATTKTAKPATATAAPSKGVLQQAPPATVTAPPSSPATPASPKP